MRTVPHIDQSDNEQKLLAAISQLQNEDAELNINAQILSRFPGYVIDSESEFCKIGAESVRQVVGRPPSLSICSAALETAFFHQYGTQPLAYGPGIPSCAHTADEYVLISEMIQSVKVYTRIAELLLAKK